MPQSPPRQYSVDAQEHLTIPSEGVKLYVYPDPGTGGEPWTAGAGHTGPDVHPGMTVTMDMARAWLKQDLQTAVDDVNSHVHVPLTQHQFDALVDFAFNCGIGNFNTSTLCRLVNAGKFDLADDEFARWVRGGGHILPGLVKRRALEKQWFNTRD